MCGSNNCTTQNHSFVFPLETGNVVIVVLRIDINCLVNNYVTELIQLVSSNEELMEPNNITRT